MLAVVEEHRDVFEQLFLSSADVCCGWKAVIASIGSNIAVKLLDRVLSSRHANMMTMLMLQSPAHPNTSFRCSSFTLAVDFGQHSPAKPHILLFHFHDMTTTKSLDGCHGPNIPNICLS